ncbi:MAG: hypothetical protein D6826_10585 [Alphaproteobacteria bacterium]|nr:MAG: hypothetical protein D6826_10585 [Alphaproteobacteria bacterium]
MVDEKERNMPGMKDMSAGFSRFARMFAPMPRAIAGLGIALGLMAALGACTIRPYAVAPPSAVVAGTAEKAASPASPSPSRRVVALCYGRLVDSPQELLEEARYQCGGPVRLLEQDLLWTPCGLLQPMRATFECLPSQIPSQ